MDTLIWNNVFGLFKDPRSTWALVDEAFVFVVERADIMYLQVDRLCPCPMYEL